MEKEKVLLEAVIIFPERGQEILLARKTKKIGAGLWNGYGGGIEVGETPIKAAIRELKEECGIEAHLGLTKKVAEVIFHNTTADNVAFDCRCHVFFTRRWKGEIRATEEMAEPTFFPKVELPLNEMMLADQAWLPPVMQGYKIRGEAWYGPKQSVLLKPTIIQVVESFD